MSETGQLDPKVIDTFFPQFTRPPADQTIEVGFVLGGTVSVGTYTCGALDLFAQAMDRWDSTKPPHKVLVTHLGGSSGGAVSAAMLAVASNRSFQHVETAQGQNAASPINPFWKVWVEDFDILKLTDTQDIPATNPAPFDGPIPSTVDALKHDPQYVWSVLNATMIDKAKQTIVTYAHGPNNFVDRQWFAKPIRVAITVANMRGIPYKLKNIPKYAGYSGNAFYEHDDYCWFAYPNWLNGQLPVGYDVVTSKSPTEFWLNPNDPPNKSVMSLTVGYDVLADWGAASGAVPLGLRGRVLSRPTEHYRYRPSVRTAGDGQGGFIAIVDFPQPDWSELVDWNGAAVDPSTTPYTFTAVDGGTFNNDPFKIVHTAMAGTLGLNPKQPEKANRAIFMIDPLVNEPGPLYPSGESLVNVVSNIQSTYTSGARYLTADMDLFADQNVFSRFQLVPTRSVIHINGSKKYKIENGQINLVGSDALAGSDFGAVAGWCCRDFRVHDYLLGRHNMLEYLRKEFILKADNPLFDHWNPEDFTTYALHEDGSAFTAFPAERSAYFLPIIPIPSGEDFGAGHPPAWPTDKLAPATILDQFSSRLEAVIKQVRKDNISGVLAWIAGLILPGYLAGKLAKSFINKGLCQPLYDKQLLSKETEV